jgi:ubiquinone/menaquinone biosynthesis C-methylase UbiE
MADKRSAAKRIVGGIYSLAADRLYEPIVVRGAFPFFGGKLNDHVVEQGRRAVAAAGGGPILDMPVGTAYFTTRMAAAHSGLIVGADIAWGMVRRAARASASRRVSNLAPVQADAHRLPFADGSFASVVCSNGLQVIPDVDATVAELARVLAPGGQLFISVVALPIGAALPPSVSDRLPVVLKGRRGLLHVLARAGFMVTSSARDRLGVLVEARKR